MLRLRWRRGHAGGSSSAAFSRPWRGDWPSIGHAVGEDGHELPSVCTGSRQQVTSSPCRGASVRSTLRYSHRIAISIQERSCREDGPRSVAGPFPSARSSRCACSTRTNVRERASLELSSGERPVTRLFLSGNKIGARRFDAG